MTPRGDYMELKPVEMPIERQIKDEHRAYVAKLHKETYEIKIQVLNGGKLPAKAHKTDAGFDVYATDDIKLYPGSVIKHPLHIRMELPSGSWAQIETKSGLGAKGMLVYAGVIDESYRGIPHVVMTNVKTTNGYSDYNGQFIANMEPIIVKKGEKLAQFTMNPHSNNFYITEVEQVEEDTDRGSGGFGSSGKA